MPSIIKFETIFETLTIEENDEDKDVKITIDAQYESLSFWLDQQDLAELKEYIDDLLMWKIKKE